MGLNEKQREAVEYLSGPLLVLAGPGTGKTQLLSEKVAYILKKTDTNASNILCLTFTESGASNMRERLKSIIGNDALKVNIGTYHSFGQDILAQYRNFSPDYDRVIDAAIDEVTQFKIVKEIRDTLPAKDILYGDKIKDIVSVISEAKAAGLSSAELSLVAKQNMEDSKVLSSAISPLLSNIVPRKFKESYERAYAPVYEILKKYENLEPIVPGVERIIVGMARTLKAAILEAEAAEKIGPLSSWKDEYFEKDGRGGYRLADRVANKKLSSVAVVMEKYQEYLTQNGLCDFDDMIIEAGRILKEDDGFRDTLQERYQFIMLDEFQDTNPSQLTIVKQLTDYEKPIIMAVGDDDQAIYEFQGANATNLSDFQEYYEAHVVTLVENYRSTQEILDFSKQVIDQAPNRFVGEKPLTAHRENPKKSQIHRVEFLSSDQEYAFVADKIAELIKSGVKQSEIAVISNKHKYFMPLLPYLKAHAEIKIAYERRDNLFEDEKIHEILTILRLVDEISREVKPTVSMLEVFAYDWLDVPMLTAVKLVGEARAAHKPVFDYLLNTKSSEEIHTTMEFLSELLKKSLTEPLELVLSFVASKMNVDTMEPYEMFSFYENLASLKAKLIKHVGEKPLRVRDLIQMVDDYAQAEMPLNTTSPYKDADEAVQILSAHKAKGLEFEYVFILSADHSGWGKGKGNNSFLTLPDNLTHIRHTGITDSERIRVLYVALTRAKQTLFITNSLHDFAGKSPDRLEYLEEYVNQLDNGGIEVISPFLPDKKVQLAYTEGELSQFDEENPCALLFSANQRSAGVLKKYLVPFVDFTPDMNTVYLERLKGWRMSASALTSFIDIVNAGPEEFFKNTVLRAEREPEDESLALGNLAHATFEQVTNSGLSDAAAMEFYLSELDKKDLLPEVKDRIREKGPEEISIALKEFSSILRSGKAEVNLAFEKLAIDGVPVTGKIDHIAVDEEAKTIEIYDFKTGKYYKEKWQSQPTLYKYMLQLLFYKLLLNNSPTFSKYKVTRGHILFVRPDVDGEVYDKVYEFDPEDEKMLLELIQAVYYQISDLKFLGDKDVMMPANKDFKLREIKAFIKLLLAKFEER
ncbi:ATP-dependent helicase [Candidatus Saccharibacteria bacterium]|nr:ATP-dependent helicase [Candidatus Saccharibacteria bacterium]